MGLFNFGKKEDVNKSSKIKSEKNEITSPVKVLGTGCEKCYKLEEGVNEVLLSMGSEIKVEHVEDYMKIASYGVMSTPALVINDKVYSQGKLLSKSEIGDIIEKSNILKDFTNEEKSN